MSRRRLAPLLHGVLVGLVVAGCGATSGRRPTTTGPQPATTGFSTAAAAAPRSHPQAIEPTAGAHGFTGRATGRNARAIVGDPHAHAPSLATVKRELRRLNLCGGATSAADASPIVVSKAPGFVADPGTQQTEGRLPTLTAQLNALGTSLGVTIYGISGYRSPSHSVAVGGYADDPHTRGEAEDIGVNSLLRSSAAQISEAQLARFGLYRPFDPTDDPGNAEVNHVQLIPSGGPLSPAVVSDTYDPDPSCR